MRKFLFLSIFILNALFALAQAPQKFNYQGVARDASGKALIQTDVTLQVAIVSSNDLDRPIYLEEHTVNTGKLGMFNLQIGGGEVLEGNMDQIDWGASSHFLSIRMDTEGSGNFQEMGISQLLSVPYALYAEKSGSAAFSEGGGSRNDPNDWTINGNTGTDETVNFIGTTDAQDLVIKTNSTEVARFTTEGNIELNANASIKAGTQNILNAIGTRNIHIGRDAGAVSTGSQNSFIGSSAGSSNTTGYDNAFIGPGAGRDNTTGYRNVFIGFSTGRTNTTGYRNTFIGGQSGFSNTEGFGNSGIGFRTGYANTTGIRNTFIGDYAGQSNTTGYFNTYVGKEADGAPDIFNATAIGAGAYAAESNTVILGNGVNVGIGTSAPQSELHVVGNIRMVDGNQQAGYIAVSDTNGTMSWTSPLSISPSSMADTDGDTKIQLEETTDEDTIRVDVGGNEVLVIDDMGRIQVKNIFRSVAIGQSTPTYGSFNVLVGYEAGKNIGVGVSNVGIGMRSLKSMSSGDFNVAVGREALHSNSSGQYNVAIGGLSGSSNQGSGNIFIGTLSGAANNGSDNIFLGTYSALNETGSNKLYIENSSSATPLIYGEFDNDLLRFNGDVEVEGSLQIADGTQADGYILSSDANGNASWIDPDNITSDSQTLALSGDTLSISNGNSLVLPSDSIWIKNGSALYQNNSNYATGSGFAAGQNSFANGSGTVAIGLLDTVNSAPGIAIGTFNSTGLDYTSTFGSVLGHVNQLNGRFSTVVGYNNTLEAGNNAQGSSGIFGAGNTVNTFRSYAFGRSNTLNGYQSYLIGETNTDNSDWSFGMGASNSLNATQTFALGYWLIANSYQEMVFGSFNDTIPGVSTSGWVATDPAFTFGIGQDPSIRANAMVILKNGNAGIGTNTPDTTFHLVGKMKYEDGTETAGYVLTSDADGNASWATPAIAASLADADNDTKIQVEESSDENIIRFDMAGTEYFNMNAGRLNVLNTGRSVFIGESAGQNDDLSNNDNVFIGYNAGQEATTSTSNTAVGSKALAKGNAVNNTAIGFGAVGSSASSYSGNSNTGVGFWTLTNTTEGFENVAVGVSALKENITGSRNTAIGMWAGYDNSGSNSNTSGGNNTFLGFGAGLSTSTQVNNATAIGSNAKVGASNSMVLGGTGGFAVNVGIGSTTPADKLHVVGNIRMVDGNQQAGYILTSDANGTASWQSNAAISIATVFETLNGVVLPGSAVDETTDDFVFGSTQLDDDGNTAHDNRFFFDKSKGAFRAGQVINANWDNSNIGTASLATGYGTKASGNYSTAIGLQSTASGTSSTAMGYGTIASGDISTAMGYQTTASGNTSIAMGNSATASGGSSIALGNNTTASGNTSIAMGSGTTANNSYSTAMGAATTASGYASTAMGAATTAASGYETVIGTFNTTYTPNNTGSGWHDNDRMFVIGNGTGTSNRSDAMVVLKSGNTGLGISAPSATLDVVGTLQYVDGTQADGRVLTSDANGNASWQPTIPVGSVQMYVGTTVPDGWLLCNGGTFVSGDYPLLYAVLGNSNTLPDFRGRFPLGTGNNGGTYATQHDLGDTGGFEKHQLTVNEMPAHTHGLSYTQRSFSGSNNGASDFTGSGASDATGSAGGNVAHNNMPPFYTLNFIIKAR